MKHTKLNDERYSGNTFVFDDDKTLKGFSKRMQIDSIINYHLLIIK